MATKLPAGQEADKEKEKEDEASKPALSNESEPCAAETSDSDKAHGCTSRLHSRFPGCSKEADDSTTSAILLGGIETSEKNKADLLCAIQCLQKEYTCEEECQLEKHYKDNPHPSDDEMREMALQWDKNTIRVKNWFKRRRAYDMLQQVRHVHHVSRKNLVDFIKQWNTDFEDHWNSCKDDQWDEASDSHEFEKFYKGYVLNEEHAMEAFFRANAHPSRDEIRRFSISMGASPWLIDEWFYDRRVSERRKNMGEVLDKKPADFRASNIGLRVRFLPLPLSDWNFTWAEIDFLELYFGVNTRPSATQINRIADLLNTSLRNVVIWLCEHKRNMCLSIPKDLIVESSGSRDNASSEMMRAMKLT